MKKIRNWWQWLVYSSKNTSKWSLFVKSGGSLVVLKILPVFVWLGFAISGSDITTITDGVSLLIEKGGLLIQNVAEWLLIAGTVIGGVRKIWRTFRGTNHPVVPEN